MWWYCVSVSTLRKAIDTCHPVEMELVFVALVLLAWQTVRIPLEGDVGVALDHAGAILRIEDGAGIDIESAVIRRASFENLTPTLTWLYANIHLPVLFGSLAALRLLAPERYPRLRTIFALSFVPAALVIWLYPLAPPRWLPQLGMGPVPTQAELGADGALFHNETAAAASQHFGFAVFVAVAAVWLFPRRRLAWAALAYPALVLPVIVATGNHYVFDCLVGIATFAVAVGCAALLHGRRAAPVAPPPETGGIALVAVGYGLVAWGLISVHVTNLATWSNVAGALALAAGVAAVKLPRLGIDEGLAESG